MSKLPEKKSELIRLAIADLEKCEADPNYKIDMSDWHDPYDENGEITECKVCLAGAVMAKTFKFDREEDFGPFDVETGATEKFYFLNQVRGYNLDNCGLESGIVVLDEHKLTYKQNPEIFKKNMLQIAGWFEEAEQ